MTAGAPEPGADRRDDGQTEDFAFSDEEFSGLRSGGVRTETGPDEAPAPTSTRRVLPLESQASAQVEKYLFPSEKFRGEWRRHWIHLTSEIVIVLLVTVVLGFLSGYLSRRGQSDALVAAVLIWVGVIGWALWKIVDWHYDRFILTNKRVMVVNGLITRNVAMMPLVRVTDMKYVQSPMGRVLNYGTFEIESAGQDQALRRVDNMPNPNELYLRIVEEMYEPEAVEARLSQANAGSGDDGT